MMRPPLCTIRHGRVIPSAHLHACLRLHVGAHDQYLDRNERSIAAIPGRRRALVNKASRLARTEEAR